VPLRLYLDDSTASKHLAGLLRDAGHEVVTPAEANLGRRNDEVHFQFAAGHGLTLLTRHGKDLRVLHEDQPQHPGVLVVAPADDPQRELSDDDIVRAIARLDLAGAPVAGALTRLNDWAR
jgi:hypothetical protein